MRQRGKKREDEEVDVYENVDELLDNDEISDEHYGFMMGYNAT